MPKWVAEIWNKYLFANDIATDVERYVAKIVLTKLLDCLRMIDRSAA